MIIQPCSDTAHLSTRLIGVAILLASVFVSGTAVAQNAKSLNNCQTVVGEESGKYTRALTENVGKCLQKASRSVLVKDGSAADARNSCVSRLARIENSAAPDKELGGRFEAKLDKACNPATNESLEHQEADVYSIGATTISAGNLGAFCEGYGGDGTVDSFDEWRDCLRAAAECQAHQSIAAQYPRALEYFEVLGEELAMERSRTKLTDSRNALADLEAAIEGTTDDNLPEVVCGGGPGGDCTAICGNGIAEAGEMCDVSDLNGSSCSDLGFFGGSLRCAGCLFDTSKCLGAGLPATGQVSGYGMLSDGSVRAGAVLSYTDNGDGTVSDNNTGLMWEKKDYNEGSVHYFSNVYTWCTDTAPEDFVCDDPQQSLDGTVLTDFLNTLNDVAAGGVSCFAGYCDWRLPNYKELLSIGLVEDLPGGVSIDPAFHKSATCSGCTDVTLPACSCTSGRQHWTSTALSPPGGDNAWVVDFSDVVAFSDAKAYGNVVARAVRGGL